MSEPLSCTFYSTLPSGVRSHSALQPTFVDGTVLVNTTFDGLEDWSYTSDALPIQSDIRVWLRLRQATVAGFPKTAFNRNVFAEVSELFSQCHLPLSCPSSAGKAVRHSVAVLIDEEQNSPQMLRVVFACENPFSLFLQEHTYQWKSGHLHRTKERLLLTVNGTAAPHLVRVVTAADLFSSVVVVQSHPHTHVFHLRSGLAVQQRLAPPVAVLPLQWELTRAARQQRRHVVAQHGCLTDGLVGLISHDTDRAVSTFHLAALPLVSHTPAASTAPAPPRGSSALDTTRVLLEMTTPALLDADGDLVTVCGLAQRLVYTRCSLHRQGLQLSPLLLEDTLVELEVAVYGAVASSAEVSARRVRWQRCGSQRYTAAVRRLQTTAAAPEWLVGPLVKEWSAPVKKIEMSEPHAVTASAPLTYYLTGERRTITCVFNSKSAKPLRFFEGRWRRREACFRHTSSVPSSDGEVMSSHATPLSAQCRQMTRNWWQPPPSQMSRWVCAATQCSMTEWLALFVLSTLVSLIIRCFVRSGVLPRFSRHLSFRWLL